MMAILSFTRYFEKRMERYGNGIQLPIQRHYFMTSLPALATLCVLVIQEFLLSLIPLAWCRLAMLTGESFGLDWNMTVLGTLAPRKHGLRA